MPEVVRRFGGTVKATALAPLTRRGPIVYRARAMRPTRWLLLRGLAREKRHWGAFPDRFASGVGAPTTCLDLPGMGTEVGVEVPASIAGITDDLRRRWLATLTDSEGPAGLFAVSLGGMILMDWCTRYPQDFARAVLVCSSAANLSPIHHRLKPDKVPTLLGSVLEKDAFARERRVLSMITNLQADPDALARAWAGYAQDVSPKRSALVRQLWAASRFRAPDRLGVPLFVLGTKADRFVDPRCTERLVAHFGAPVRWHDTAGHDLPADAPEWVIEQVRSWVG